MELISLILNFILASGLIGTLLFYGSKKRQYNAEAKGAEWNAQGSLLGQYEAFIDTMTDEKKLLQVEVSEARAEAREARRQEASERERVVTAYKERSDALVELEIMRGQFKLAEWNKCETPSCSKRKPPRIELQHEN